MTRKFFLFALLFAVTFSSFLSAAKVATATKPVDPIVLTNQMLLVFMERMKTGNLKEAREIADEMVFGHEKLPNTKGKESKSFHSAMEKELYQILQAREGEKKIVTWVQQPISDGFYLLSILDFQQGNHEKALENLQRAIYWNPVRSAFFAERGFMLLKKKTGPDMLMAQIAYRKALDLADNAEDFAAALRGLAFVMVERQRLSEALACLLVSKTFDSASNDAEEEMLFIQRYNPGLFASMSLADAKKLLATKGIPTNFAPEHVKVLIKLADELASGKVNEKAILLLKKAKEMDPANVEVNNRLKRLQK